MANASVFSPESVRNTPSSEPLPPAAASSQASCPSEIMADLEGSYHGSTTTEEEPSYSSNLPPHRSAHPHTHAHPLKSFAVPAIPAGGHAPYEPPALPSTPLLAQTGGSHIVTGRCVRWTGGLTGCLCCFSLGSGPPTHPHVVKTASIGTLGRTRTPMVVTVPNAPDVPETSKMLEDVDSVSTRSREARLHRPCSSMAGFLMHLLGFNHLLSLFSLSPFFPTRISPFLVASSAAFWSINLHLPTNF